jgi:wyosine [tRNA(Phe)-imidazoG37] synthetase (radical SAM superfamily)
MYQYLFGPVPSRRLGMSLGVDLVPHKVCSLDCVYCECGPTTRLTLDRKEYILYRKVTAELDHYFANNPDPDYITFSGSGEPTLNSRIGDVLKYIRKHRPHIPVAVLTNGTLLHLESVRNELLDADVVLPSLDAATPVTFRRINRPPSQLILQDYIEGLVMFRKAFSGQIWLEVFIIPGYNDHQKELDALKEAFERIRPDRIQLNTLDRPGTVEDLQAASHHQLKQIVNYWDLDRVEIISNPMRRKDIRAYREDTETAILETIARRPCTGEDLASILGLHLNEVNKYLDVLEAEEKIRPVRQQRGIFYRKI